VEEKKTGEKEPGVGCRRSEYRRILPQGETGMTNEGIVVEYDPRWPRLFEEEPDCSHFPWLEQPAAFRSAVEELLS
jgi:pimeloyl-ACP methyl ester carboxylesterase